MPTLDEMMSKFASASPQGGSTPPTTNSAVGGDGQNKLAGENNMSSLQDIYLAIAGQDHQVKEAAAAQAPNDQPSDDDAADFAKMAQQLAEQEAVELDAGEQEHLDMVKVAQEYDSAGRIMARGFFDEFCKLAAGVTTEADNQNTETPSQAKTPALGERGLPTLETNYAGTVDTGTPGKQPQMNGPEPKRVYADSLETTKTINAGQGTGDDPEAAAIALGGGSPIGFATIRDLQV